MSVLVWLGQSMELSRAERMRRKRNMKKRRRWWFEGEGGGMCLCWGEGGPAPPLIKLACCTGGACLQDRRGSFLHLVDSSELSHSLSCNSSSTALRRADPHTQADPGRVGGSSDSISCHPPCLHGLRPHLVCSCLHCCSHHVWLFPPGLPQLACCLLGDRWAFSFYLFFLCWFPV